MKNDDLLNIGNNDNKKNLRKVLIYAAIGFLIFVIAIIAVALYQNKSSKEENAILPPQVNEQNQLFKEVPIEKSESENEKVNKETNNSINLIKPETKQNSQKTALEKNVTSMPKNTAVSLESPKKKTEIKQKPKKHQQKKVFKTKYYIQVAALLKNSKPNKKFLNLISKYGYKYSFYTVNIKKGNEKIKVTKVLVGPFKNRKEALNNLLKIKKYITSNAFIFKVK